MRGFTLVELLVVVLIIGLFVGVIDINIGGNSNYKLRTEARQFANNTALMAEEAVLANQQWGVDLYREVVEGDEQFGYRWLVMAEDGRWELPNNEEFAEEYVFSPGIMLRLQLDGLDTEQEIDFKQRVETQLSVTEVAASRQRSDVIDADNSITKVEAVSPDLWLLSSGEMSPFIITLFDEKDPNSFVEVQGDELGRVAVDSGDVDDY